MGVQHIGAGQHQIGVDHFHAAHHFQPSIIGYITRAMVLPVSTRIGALVHHTSDYGCPGTKSFSGTAHSKGPMDGTGAEVMQKV